MFLTTKQPASGSSTYVPLAYGVSAAGIIS